MWTLHSYLVPVIACMTVTHEIDARTRGVVCELLQIKYLCVGVYTGLHWTSYFKRQARVTCKNSQSLAIFELLSSSVFF